MKIYRLQAWFLKPAERVVLLVVCAVSLAVLVAQCRRLRTEQPEFIPSPEEESDCSASDVEARP